MRKLLGFHSFGFVLDIQVIFIKHIYLIIIPRAQRAHSFCLGTHFARVIRFPGKTNQKHIADLVFVSVHFQLSFPSEKPLKAFMKATCHASNACSAYGTNSPNYTSFETVQCSDLCSRVNKQEHITFSLSLTLGSQSSLLSARSNFSPTEEILPRGSFRWRPRGRLHTGARMRDF